MMQEGLNPPIDALLQRALDLLGDEPGSLLYRGLDRWIALPPGNIGDVLICDEGAMPAWRDPALVPFGR